MNEDTMLIIGNRLKLIRAEAKMKQKEFAAQFGIAPTTYSGYESGKHEPTIDFLIQIAEKYDLSLDYVVGRALAKEGRTQDEFNKLITDSLVEPLKKEGASDLEIMKEMYASMRKSLDETIRQMDAIRDMIEEKEKEEQ